MPISYLCLRFIKGLYNRIKGGRYIWSCKSKEVFVIIVLVVAIAFGVDCERMTNLQVCRQGNYNEV